MFPALHGPVSLEPGRLIVVGPAAFSTGGAVSNTGLALHRLGVDVRLVGKVGADVFGRAVLDGYRALDPRLAAGMTTAADSVTSYTIVINPPNVDRTFLHCPGANETFSADDVRDEQLAGARMFHFGYPPLMPRMYAAGGEELRRLFERAGTAGAVTSLDLCVPDPDSDAGRIDWEEVLRNTLQFVDVFAPSIDELLFMLDRPRHQRLRDGTPISAVVDRACLRELADRVIGLGTRIVAIKLGEHGLYVRVSADADAMESICRRLELDPSSWCDRELLSPCFQADRIAGTTGSGDATIAGLLMAMLRGGPPTDAATIATAVGACSVESVDPTSGIPPWPELQTRLEQGWPRHAVALDVGAEEAGRDAAGTVILR